MFTCSNLRNKKCDLKVEKNSISINNEIINVTKAFYLKCSLKREHATFIFLLSDPYAKKSELFLELSWLQNNKKMEDEARVNLVNNKCTALFENSEINIVEINEDNCFEGRIEGTYDLADIFKINDYLISPASKKLLDLIQYK